MRICIESPQFGYIRYTVQKFLDLSMLKELNVFVDIFLV